MKHATFKADALLLLAAAIWGSGFVAQRIGNEHVGPFTFTGIRFLIGALVLWPLIAWRTRGGMDLAPRPQDRAVARWGGLLAGGLLMTAASLQQVGLIWTTAGKAGFITGLYVVLVPVLGVFIGHRTSAWTWWGAVLAAVGLYFLSVTKEFTLSPGDGYVLACAVIWAVHVQVIGWLSPRTDPLRLAAMQFAVTGVLGTLVAFVCEDVTVARLSAGAPSILYSGLLVVGVAYTLQVVGQRAAPPAHAAILLSLEAVFAALCGWAWLAEVLGPRELLGCALMLAAMLLSQVRRVERA